MSEGLGLLSVGEVIAERFQITGVLGEGGMGSVYEALQLNLTRPVALKVLLPQFGVQPEARRRFEREARVAAALRHSGVVTIYDFGEDGGRLYLAMERLRGETLRAELSARGDPGLPLIRALQIAQQICDVLVAAHDQGLVHRDLKPENIFLERSEAGSERVVVVDFGLAFIEDREEVGRMTRDGILSGTPEYASPEQVRAKSVGPPTDIYSFGCLLYELVTGDVPLRGADPFETVSHQVFTAPLPPSELLPASALPRALEELILQMLEKAPGRRPSASVALERLRRIRANLGGRERSKEEHSLEGRASRMIPKPREPISGDTLTEELPDEEAAAEVLVLGLVDEELRTALAVNGLRLVLEEELGGADPEVIYAPGAGVEELARRREGGGLLLTDADPADIGRVSQLLALGVDDVVPRPVRYEELSRKIWRAIRKMRRSARRSRG